MKKVLSLLIFIIFINACSNLPPDNQELRDTTTPNPAAIPTMTPSILGVINNYCESQVDSGKIKIGSVNLGSDPDQYTLEELIESGMVSDCYEKASNLSQREALLLSLSDQGEIESNEIVSGKYDVFVISEAYIIDGFLAKWVTLRSPFAEDCGDGIPVIWSNDAYNGPWYPNCGGTDWGHVDFMVPEGCDVNNFKGEVVAPVTGTNKKYDYGDPISIGYHLTLPLGTYINGIIEALIFSGIEEPDINKISSIYLDIGHLDPKGVTKGLVSIGSSIADIMPYGNHQKIGYRVTIIYEGREFSFTPTLFPNELPDGSILRPMLNGNQENWFCSADTIYKNYPNSDEDCIPEQHDYAPDCSALKSE